MNDFGQRLITTNYKPLVWYFDPFLLLNVYCTTIHKYPIFSTRYSVMCKVYTGYCGTSEIEHGLCACTVDNPLAKARGLSLRTGAQTMLYLSLVVSNATKIFKNRESFITSVIIICSKSEDIARNGNCFGINLRAKVLHGPIMCCNP